MKRTPVILFLLLSVVSLAAPFVAGLLTIRALPGRI